MPKDYHHRLVTKADAELYAMLERCEDYLPEAIEAVYAELRRRNLTSDQASKAVAAVAFAHAQARARAEMPLSRGAGWLMLVLVPVAWRLAAWIPLYYLAEGYERKARESGRCLFRAVGFWLLIGSMGFLWLSQSRRR